MSDEQTPQEHAETPPWGSPEAFDPERAWNLIQGLRADKDKLAKRAFASEDEFEAAKSARERLAEIEREQMSELEFAQNALLEAREAAQATQTEALRWKAAATHGIPSDFFEFIGGGTEEEVLSRAERLGGLIRAASNTEVMQQELESLKAGSPLQNRSVADLKPGATPTDNQNEDDVLYNTLYGGSNG